MGLKHWLFLLSALACLALDQGSKAVVRAWPEGASQAWIPGLLSTVHLENPGGVLGLAADWPLALKLAVFGVAAVGMGTVAWLWLARSSRVARVAPLGLGLLIGGALGNSVDRVVQGTVTDFLVVGQILVRPLLPLVPWVDRTPAFNLADAFLGLGIVVLAGLVVRTTWLSRRDSSS